MGERSLIVATLAVAAACATEELRPSSDAGVVSIPDAGTVRFEIAPPLPPLEPLVDEGLRPAEPAVPALPSLAPCPSGWRELANGDCEPWPASGRATCPVDQAHFPGAPGCELLGTACDPNDDFAIDLPASGVVYVKPGAAAGGTGTRAAPHATIADALATTVSGTIALAKGTYAETMIVPAGVTIAGACVAETILTSTASANRDGLVDLLGDGAAIRNVTIAAEAQPAISASGGAVFIREAAVARAFNGAVLVRGGHARIDAISVRDPGDAFGVSVIGGASCELARAVIDRAGNVALHAQDAGSILVASDVAVLHPEVLGAAARGAQSIIGASMTLSRSVFEELSDELLVSDGGSLDARDVVVRDAVLTGGDRGYGVVARRSGSARIERVRIERVGPLAVWGFAEAAIDARDVVVRTTSVARGRSGGGGAFVFENAGATLSRVSIERAADFGVVLENAIASIADLSVRETIGRDDHYGVAVQIGPGSSCDLTRGRFSDNAFGAIGVRGTAATIRDVSVVNNGRRTTNTGGAIYVDSGEANLIERADIVGSRGPSLNVLGAGVHVVASDVHVSGTRGLTEGNTGVIISGIGARLELSKTRLEDNVANAAIFMDRGALEARDAVIAGSEEPGVGLVVFQDSDASLERVVFEGHRAGAIVLEPGPPGTRPRLGAADLIIRDTGSDREPAAAISASGRSFHVDLFGARIERTFGAGIQLRGGLDARASFVDVFIGDTMPYLGTPRTNPELTTEIDGFGLTLREVAFTGERIAIDGATTVGFDLAASTATISDLSIRASRADGLGYAGRALAVSNGSSALISRAKIEDVVETAVVIGGRGTFARFEELSCARIAKAPCMDPRFCVSVGAAVGISAGYGGRADVRRFSITGSEVAGVQVARDGALDLHEGTISGNPIGANVQDENYDVTRLSDDVAYFDNDVDLDSRTLPVPAPIEED